MGSHARLAIAEKCYCYDASNFPAQPFQFAECPGNAVGLKSFFCINANINPLVITYLWILFLSGILPPPPTSCFISSPTQPLRLQRASPYSSSHSPPHVPVSQRRKLMPWQWREPPWVTRMTHLCRRALAVIPGEAVPRTHLVLLRTCENPHPIHCLGPRGFDETISPPWASIYFFLERSEIFIPGRIGIQHCQEFLYVVDILEYSFLPLCSSLASLILKTQSVNRHQIYRV